MTDQPILSTQPDTTLPVNSVISSSDTHTVNDVVAQQVMQQSDPRLSHIFTQLSQEEHQAIIQKMVQVAHQPATNLPKEEQLYLEQQLTDMLGFEVTSELNGYHLQQSTGVMSALPHLKRFPTDTLAQHELYKEAGIRAFRSSFSWFTELGQLTPQAIEREKYYVAVQASFLPQWQENPQLTREWFKFRKMVVINAVDQKAVVAVVGDIGPAEWMKAQFGGSPEIIREAKVWSIDNKGHVLVYFINDPTNQVPLGVHDLRYGV
jgi:hypothetical protein